MTIAVHLNLYRYQRLIFYRERHLQFVLWLCLIVRQLNSPLHNADPYDKYTIRLAGLLKYRPTFLRFLNRYHNCYKVAGVDHQNSLINLGDDNVLAHTTPALHLIYVILNACAFHLRVNRLTYAVK